MIRNATPADFDAILRINDEAQPKVMRLSRDELATVLAAAPQFLVWTEDGRIVGYVIVYTNAVDYDGEEFAWFRANLPGSFLYVDQIAIAPEAQGRGIGRRIYEALIERARTTGTRSLACEVNLLPSNPESLAFHARVGFVEAGRMATSDGREVCLLTRVVGAAVG